MSHHRFCEAIAHLGHERIGCGQDEGHDGPHWNEWGAWPQCALCGGLDEHSDTCPEPGTVERAFIPAFVEWESGGKPWVGTRAGLQRRRERREQEQATDEATATTDAA